MKKFLSLVLALVMTMSLVTISAGAAEYKDLTDKNEIEYEEAVAVLNRLGIITGYSEGDFRPKTELTRGAAAKIIVSLLIGTDAANNLVPSTAPYSDVPVDHTFAGVISYCKNSSIINGYQDGTFRPQDTLSGYAFTKMLLGALGYKGELEGGFTGAGWNMNVARLGAEAGLFDRLSFKGNEAVTREQACQLALNTLKATMVEYTGGFTVSAGDASVVGAQSRSYKTSNQDYARHIYERQVDVNQSGWYTVEFGEEHFVDLRLEHDKSLNKTTTPNDMGQPSAEWSYKKVTIGTYALEPDFSYTELVAHNDKSSTEASKRRALGLADYKVSTGTTLWLNGYPQTGVLSDVAEIADYTGNGTVVEVYVSNQTADLITDVVVIQSALMEVKRIGSDYVTIAKYDTDGADDRDGKEGYNRDAFDLANAGDSTAPADFAVKNKAFIDVQIENDNYALLSGLKVGDKVVIIPVSEDRSSANFDVWDAYVPETVTGTLTRVDNYGSSSNNRGTIGLTVGGTAYKAAEWNKDIIGISGEDIKATKKDVTLTLDKYGNALLAEDVGATKNYMVVGNYYQSLENGRLVTYVHGWDVGGDEVDLNLGNGTPAADAVARMKPGDLVRYISNTTGSAEWTLQDAETSGNPGKIYAIDHTANTDGYQITAYNTKVALLQDTTGGATANPDVTISSTAGSPTTVDFASGVKFIYVEFNDDHEVESVEIRSGVQAVSNAELKACHDSAAITTQYQSNEWNTAEAYVSGKDNDDGKDTRAVKAVVIKRESNTAISSNLLYIRDYLGSAQKTDSSNKIIYGYTVVMNTSDGLAGEAKTIYSYENLSVGSFASYAEVQNDQVSDFYKLRQHTNRTEKTTTSFVVNVAGVLESNNNILILDPTTYKVPETRAGFGTATGTTPGDGTAGSRSGLPDISMIDYDGDEDKQIGELVDRVRVSSRTQWVDLTTNHIASTKDMKDFVLGDNSKPLTVAMVVNDNVESDGFRDVAMIIIEEAWRTTSGGSPTPPPPSSSKTLKVELTNVAIKYSIDAGEGYGSEIIMSSNGNITVPVDATMKFVVSPVGDDVGSTVSTAGSTATVSTFGSEYYVSYADITATTGDLLKVAVAANPHTVKNGSNGLTGWTLATATMKHGTDAAVDVKTDFTGSGVTAVKGDVFTITFTQDVSAATSIDNESVAFGGSEAAQSSSVVLSQAHAAAAVASWTEIAGNDDTAKAATLSSAYAAWKTDTSKPAGAEFHVSTSGSGTTGTQVTDSDTLDATYIAGGGTPITHYGQLDPAKTATITVTFTVGTTDLTMGTVTIA